MIRTILMVICFKYIFPTNSPAKEAAIIKRINCILIELSNNVIFKPYTISRVISISIEIAEPVAMN